MFKCGDIVKVTKHIKESGQVVIASQGMREVLSDNQDGTLSLGLIGASKLSSNKVNIVKSKYVEKTNEVSSSPHSFFEVTFGAPWSV